MVFVKVLSLLEAAMKHYVAQRRQLILQQVQQNLQRADQGQNNILLYCLQLHITRLVCSLQSAVKSAIRSIAINYITFFFLLLGM